MFQFEYVLFTLIIIVIDVTKLFLFYTISCTEGNYGAKVGQHQDEPRQKTVIF